MAHDFSVGSGGSYKRIRPWWIGAGGSWKKVLAAHVGVGGAWKLFYSEIPYGMIVQFDAAVPAGWSELSYSLFPLGASAAGSSDLYSDTHEHSASVTNAFAAPNSENPASTAILRDNAIIHHHENHSYSHTHGSTNHRPYALDMKAGAASTALSIPTSARLLYYGASAPAGWSDFAYTNGRHLAWTTGAYGTSGATTHSHAHADSNYDDTYDLRQYHLTSYQDAAHHENHKHTVPAHSKANEPPSIRLHMISPSSEAFTIPSNVVAFFTGDIVPFGWSVYSAALGKFIKLYNTGYGTTAGSSSHAHDEDIISGDFTAAWFRRGQSAPSTTMVTETHSHDVVGPHTAVADNLMPLSREFLICKKD